MENRAPFPDPIKNLIAKLESDKLLPIIADVEYPFLDGHVVFHVDGLNDGVNFFIERFRAAAIQIALEYKGPVPETSEPNYSFQADAANSNTPTSSSSTLPMRRKGNIRFASDFTAAAYQAGEVLEIRAHKYVSSPKGIRYLFHTAVDKDKRPVLLITIDTKKNKKRHSGPHGIAIGRPVQQDDIPQDLAEACPYTEDYYKVLNLH